MLKTTDSAGIKFLLEIIFFLCLSLKTMTLTLKEIIKSDKNNQREFSVSVDDSRKIAQTMCAFSNTEGGSIFIGVKENGKISGVNPSEEIEKLTENSLHLCKPKILFETQIWTEDFRLVLEIKIAKNPERNNTSLDIDGKWKVFIRRENKSFIANKILIKVWNLEKKKVQKPAFFNDEEIYFLKLFDDHEKKTLSILYKFSKLAKNKIDQLLALFVYWQVIEMQITDSGTFYEIKHDLKSS